MKPEVQDSLVLVCGLSSNDGEEEPEAPPIAMDAEAMTHLVYFFRFLLHAGHADVRRVGSPHACGCLDVGPTQQLKPGGTEQTEDPAVKALGWGVEVSVSIPTANETHQHAVVCDPSSGTVLFKECAWVGMWAGYIFTTIEHGGKRVSGYKLDTACEPRDAFHGPRPGKYFGLRGVVGYH